MNARSLRLTVWPRRGALACVLWPVSLLYRALAALNRALYTSGLRQRAQVGVPVVVVGNVVAGGAGKTPVVMAVVRHLRQRGLAVAVVSRGYGRSTRDCREVLPDSPAGEVGDEPLLLRQATGVPVFVAPLRADAARAALRRYPATQVIVCDDGLQHWALQRDVDICVFDERGVGNGWCLPAGPLREPWPRAVDLVVAHGPVPAGGNAPAFTGTRRLATHARRADGQQVALAELRHQPLHALAGIARPEAFFGLLADAGLTPTHTEALPDHYDFESWTARKDAGSALVCTEKDAVKLWRRFPEAWAVPLEVLLPDAFYQRLDALLAPKLSLLHGHTTA